MNIYHTIKGALDEAGAIAPLKLGPQPGRSLTNAQKEALEGRLVAAADKNQWIVPLVAAMVSVLFLTGIGLSVWYSAAPSVVAALFGGNVLSLLGLAEWLRKFWKQDAVLRTLMVTLPYLDPETATSVLIAIYFDKERANSKVKKT